MLGEAGGGYRCCLGGEYAIITFPFSLTIFLHNKYFSFVERKMPAKIGIKQWNAGRKCGILLRIRSFIPLVNYIPSGHFLT